MTVLVIMEYQDNQLARANLQAVMAAAQLSSEIHALIIGCDCEQVAQQAAQLQHISKVLCLDNPAYQYPIAQNRAHAIAELAKDYSAIIAASSSYSKDLLPRVAALLDVAMISDVIAIDGDDQFTRPIYAGNAIETIQSYDDIKLLTIRSTAFESASQRVDAPAPIEFCDLVHAAESTQYISYQASEFTRPQLTHADIVISGGRGLQSKEHFQLIEDLADCFNAAVGASRAAVDAGFAPNDYQVGQTGKVVAPSLYIAVGISGAIQHIAGMKDSRVIVAINQDADAPIMKIADYALVGDLFEIVPRLIEEFRGQA